MDSEDIRIGEASTIGKQLLRFRQRFPKMKLHDVYDLLYGGIINDDVTDGELESDSDGARSSHGVLPGGDNGGETPLRDISTNGRSG